MLSPCILALNIFSLSYWAALISIIWGDKMSHVNEKPVYAIQQAHHKYSNISGRCNKNNFKCNNNDPNVWFRIVFVPRAARQINFIFYINYI